jgi:formylglycine-generating enzyme required for sulfatase activity
MDEVTQRQFREVMGYDPSFFSASAQGKQGIRFTSLPAGGKEQVKGLDTEDFPVENVSWEDADLFCRQLNTLDRDKPEGWAYRLPTEAEWERACRGGAEVSTLFHFGNSLSATQANFDSNFPPRPENASPLRRTCKVGSYPENAFGLHDMHGNVAEWCQDWYAQDYGPDRHTNPKGPPTGTTRVFRGGHWDIASPFCRSAMRAKWAPAQRENTIGFRAALVESGRR